MNGNIISRSPYVKYLGVFLDEHMSWCEHIKHVYKGIKKFFGMFYKVRLKLPTVCLRSLYYATVYPIIQYGVELYGSTCKSYLFDLSVLNNKIFRALPFKKYNSTVIDLYVNYNTLPIDKLHSYKLLIMIHRFFTYPDSIPPIFHDYFVTNDRVHSYNTRIKKDLHLSSHATSYGTRCLAFHCGKLWNDIPTNISEIFQLLVHSLES